MYTQVATKLAVTATEYSQAVSMAGANAVEVEATVFAISAGTLTIGLEGSNDLQNWKSINAAVITAFSAAGADSSTAEQNIAHQYVRLSYTQSSGTSIVAAGINTANL